MSEKTLKFDNIEISRHKKILMFDRFKHSDDGFKYFIGYKEDDIVKPLCNILPQMSGYIKYFKNGGLICLLCLHMIACLINIMKFGTRLKRH